MSVWSQQVLTSRVNERNRKWWTLVAACFGLFMVILDFTVVNVALPSIARDLETSTTQLQWIVSAYALVFASVQITAGALGDRFGRKRWFMIGLVLFTAPSLLAALAGSAETLIAARALQGLGGALIMPLSLSLISDAFPPEERGMAVGLWSGISVSGAVLGPVVGGALVQYASWEWIFLINIPIGIGALLVTKAVARESRDESGTVGTDIPGTILSTAAIAGLVWGLIEAGNRGWGDAWILGSFAAAAVLGAAFVWVEARAEKPMVPLRLFRSSTFSGANLDAFLISFVGVGATFALTLYQQNVHGFSPIRAGLSLLPWVLPMMALFPISGALTPRVGARRLISLGMLVTGLGVLLLLRSGANADYLAIVPAYLVMGIGMSFIWSPMMTAMLNSVDGDKVGVASAINGAVRDVGNAFGIAFLGTVINRAYLAEFRESGEIAAIRADPALAPVRPVLDAIGAGAGFAGRVVEDAGRYPAVTPFPAVVAAIREASAQAFVVGMDRAILIMAAGLIAGSVLSYVLVKDPVETTEPLSLPEAEPLRSAAD